MKQLLSNIVNFENILNKKLPTASDFNSLYHGEDESEREMIIEQKYCEQLKLKYDTQPCVDSLQNLLESYGKEKPSLYLMHIKNAISGNQNVRIKLFVAPYIKPCTNIGESFMQVQTIAQIEDSKYKKILLALPCDLSNMNHWKIEIVDIAGKGIFDYPLMIKPAISTK